MSYEECTQYGIVHYYDEEYCVTYCGLKLDHLEWISVEQDSGISCPVCYGGDGLKIMRKSAKKYFQEK